DWRATRSYRSGLARDAVAAAASVPLDDLPARAAALAELLAGQHGYSGDTETYDDLANANLIRVIERRKGLPVALG
ncbi:transglutaminase family protein, partial [Staphylococcus aureus]